MTEDLVLPLINAIVFLGGAGVSAVKVLTTPLREIPGIHRWVYFLMVLVFSVVGITYLVFARGLITEDQMAAIIRPALPWIALPAYVGFFITDSQTLKQWSEFSRQQRVMNDKITQLEHVVHGNEPKKKEEGQEGEG